jgi:succinoglycan biosynthesis protein ExoL
MNDRRDVRVASLLPVLGHPRDSKRIAMLQAEGIQVEVAAFERDYHAGRMPHCPITKLGRISHGRYVTRAAKFLRALPALRRVLYRCDVAYASGPDMALAAIVAGIGLRKPVVLEIGDIRRLQVSRGIAGRVMRALDRFIASRCALLVSTAPEFVRGYYRERLGSTIPSMILENKLDSTIGPEHRDICPPAGHSGSPIRIGWFGVLRCPWSWETLARLAATHPDRFEIVIAGHPLDPRDLPSRAAAAPNVRYLGEYRSPGDLHSLYGQVDLVWTVYPGPEVTDPDWRWALLASRSNRYYESCRHKRPTVTLAESGDGAEVLRLGIGLALRSQCFSEIEAELLRVGPDDFRRWGAVLDALPPSAHSYADEAPALADLVRGLANGKPRG